VLRESAKTPVDPLLARLSAGPRAALLLRLIAGLDPAHGAEVLRVSTDAYRHALHRALHELHAQGVADADLRLFRERLQLRAKQLPDPAHRIPSLPPVLRAEPAADLRPSRRLRMALSGILVIALLAFAASFVWNPRTRSGSNAVTAQTPAATLSATADLLASPDFGWLDDPEGARLSRDLDLYAWYAAGADAGSAQPASSSLPESTAPETSAPDTEGNSGEK
jgi:hypothetical protein